VMLARNLRRNLPDMGWMRLLHLGAGAPRMALRAGGDTPVSEEFPWT
jgi:hypothetical protein